MTIEQAKERYLQGFNLGSDHRVISQNCYGALYNSGMCERFNYACHSKLAGGYCSLPDAIILSAIYINSTGWSHEEQNRYFEYILSPETSPWRQVIERLGDDLDIIRKSDGTITFIVVKNPGRFNRYYLFSFLKGLRQVWERRFALKLFTDIADDPEMSDDEKYRVFLQSMLFSGDSNTLQPTWGGDHHVFHGFPTEGLKRREIPDFEDNIFISTYGEDMYYFDVDMYQYTWGNYVVTPQNWLEIETLMSSRLRSESGVFGYFMTTPSSDQSKIIPFEKVKQNFGMITEVLKEQGLDLCS